MAPSRGSVWYDLILRFRMWRFQPYLKLKMYPPPNSIPPPERIPAPERYRQNPAYRYAPSRFLVPTDTFYSILYPRILKVSRKLRASLYLPSELCLPLANVTLNSHLSIFVAKHRHVRQMSTPDTTAMGIWWVLYGAISALRSKWVGHISYLPRNVTFSGQPWSVGNFARFGDLTYGPTYF